MNSLDLKQRVTQKAEQYKFAGASDEEKSEFSEGRLRDGKRPSGRHRLTAVGV